MDVKNCCWPVVAGRPQRDEVVLDMHDLIYSWISVDGCDPLVRSLQRCERFQALDISFGRLRFVGWDALFLLK
jgi:hypothetical protein